MFTKITVKHSSMAAAAASFGFFDDSVVRLCLLRLFSSLWRFSFACRLGLIELLRRGSMCVMKVSDGSIDGSRKTSMNHSGCEKLAKM